MPRVTMEERNESRTPFLDGAEHRFTDENQSISILLVDDESNIRKTLSLCLETEGYRVLAVSNVQDALAEASRRSFDLAFVDLRLGTSNGLDLIPALLAQAPWLKIIVITAYASIDTAVEAIKRGATDFISKPFTPAQVRLAVHKVLEICMRERKAWQEKDEQTAALLSIDSTPGIGDKATLEEIEELHIKKVLSTTKSFQEAAEILGIDQATLWRHRKKYKI